MSNYQLSRAERIRKNKYIDFRINGRLFPSWILANFSRYKLPEIIKKASEDPCNAKTDTGKAKLELRLYQQFVSRYLDFKSPYRDILIYHGLGSGKTGTAINVYNMLYNYTPGWNVFILLKASLKDNWLKEIKKWLKKDEYEFRYKNIIFIHYDSPVADKKFMDAVKNVDSSKKSMYIIEEVHNFIRNVYSNISSGVGKRAQKIYDYIIQDKIENLDTRVVLLSGTPAINNPFELSILFNLLRPNIFPRSETEFNHLFISSSSYETMNRNNKNLFQRRIMGLVTYYYGATPDYFATKSIQYVDVPMSDYQQDIYTHFEEIEEQIARRAKLSGAQSQMYKSYTRQACNFVFPSIDQRINGESRPRPGKFRISEREAQKLAEGKVDEKKLKAEKGSDKVMNITQYNRALEMFINGLETYLLERDADDKKSGHTIVKDIETFIKKYKGEFLEFHNNEKKKSKLYEGMTKCSMKMVNIIFNIMNSPGPVMVYSNYVHMEGLEIFKIYLKYFGFYSFNKAKKIQQGKVGYVEFHGQINREDRYIGMDKFNEPENKYGELLKIMLISPAGSEGLSLANVRQVHIMEPYWNEVRITQVIGRAIRQCSHKNLPIEDRHVNVYRYKSVRSKGTKWTTDEYIEDAARGKDALIQSFLDAMKEAAIDCVLNKNHNMLVQEYRCFQFDENNLFDKYIGPSYKEDIYDDMKMDTGLNSTRSMTLKIKVMKISAVKLLTAPEEIDREYGDNQDQEQGQGQDQEYSEPEYSEPDDYWYYPQSRVVYDYKLHYPIGKVGVDDDGLPLKLDKNTYIITQLIPMPLIKE